ncbi:MAG TPA: glycosyltransferase [Bacteroidia bacterium]|nr:glycosyltransferase [Bacteroidia bacterium]
MTVLFLYTELAEYFLKCCDELSKSCNVNIIRWPVNKEAPFDFTYSDQIKIYDKNKYTLAELEKLVATINPDIIICSGWVDKDYLKITRSRFKKMPTVLTCDTRWNGSPRQYLALILSRFFLLNTFSHAWVPGQSQYRYTRKLGFKSQNIAEGFYCCDLKKFNDVYIHNKPVKEASFPKRFLYVGRYYDFKGIEDLWTAFIQLQAEHPNEWELWCLGTGSIAPVNHPKIRHFGFVQPKDLEPILEKTGVFVLPSRFEPWGVVVQEYSAAGFPMLISEAVGANEAFLEQGKNGFAFAAKDINTLKNQLKKITNLNSKELLLMSEKSHQIAQKISPQTWAATVLNIYNGFRKK